MASVRSRTPSPLDTPAPRDAAGGDTVPAALFEPQWDPQAAPGRRQALQSWNAYLARASRIVGRFHGHYALEHFEYQHPTKLQPATPRRLKKPYPARVAYTAWGPRDAPVLLCAGGVANVAMRFQYLASDLANPATEGGTAGAPWRVVCMDWLGRGRSGWLASEGDYSLATCAEQLRQMIDHLGGGPVSVLGSSLGGSAAIDLAARHPKLVKRLILNDVGPFIPARRRRRRAETIARHYVFRRPEDLMRKIGASQKNDGPASDDIRFALTFHQTRWSDEDGGRVYRHDVRAMQAYRSGAQQSLQQWRQWEAVRCPVLLIHGLESDALLPPTIARMRRGREIAVMHVPGTGHTPLLADRNQVEFVRRWLDGELDAEAHFTVLHAAPREAFPGNPIPFAPASALR